MRMNECFMKFERGGGLQPNCSIYSWIACRPTFFPLPVSPFSQFYPESFGSLPVWANGSAAKTVASAPKMNVIHVEGEIESCISCMQLSIRPILHRQVERRWKMGGKLCLVKLITIYIVYRS